MKKVGVKGVSAPQIKKERKRLRVILKKIQKLPFVKDHAKLKSLHKTVDEAQVKVLQPLPSFFPLKRIRKKVKKEQKKQIKKQGKMSSEMRKSARLFGLYPSK